ncbi:MAG: 23S rRNA (guanosine(2251)-2'-O)-methyltransferase RlmB [Pseudomonadota bacterium]
MAEVIGGVNPVLEALRSGAARIQRIYLAENRSGRVAGEILELARSGNLSVQRVDRERLDRMYGGGGHQGVVAEVGPYQYHDFEEILLRGAGDRSLVLILDGIQDPGNLGSLLRSAEAAGAAGVVIPRERAAPVTAAAVKASAGAAEHLPVARVVNLSRALDEMKERGFWIVGADAEAGTCLYDVKLPARMGLVVGAEGRGLRRLVKEKCDLLVSIPLKGRVASLNASAAGALFLFEFVRRGEKPGPD